MSRQGARVLVVGLGGLGCPAALVLARAGVGTIGLCDDDEVDGTNLHRQILYREADVGSPKVAAAAQALRRESPWADLRLHEGRLTPERALDLVRGYDLVLEGADNFATKFLAADACAIAGVRIVHASAVRWVGTVLAVGAQGQPCYRCLFEAPPADGAPGCSEAGVMGPVVGVVAALQADLALAFLDGASAQGHLVTFDGRAESLRRRFVPARGDCALCGHGPRIRRIEPEMYAPPACAG